MKQALVVRAVISLVILAGSAFYAITETPNLGLDLRGGTQIVLETQDAPNVDANRESTDRAVEVLRRRIDALGVAEPSLTRSGDRRIIVELPGVQDPTEAANTIGRTAQLTFHEVVGPAPAPELTEEQQQREADIQERLQSEDQEASAQARVEAARFTAELRAAEAEDLIFTDPTSGERLQLAEPALTGDGVSGAEAQIDPASAAGWYVNIEFRGSGSRAWEDLTAQAACEPFGDPKRRVAIVLDQEIISSPQVNENVACGVGITGGSTMITGDFDRDEARDLSALISGGALPVPVEVVEQRTVGPTLGAAAIDASWKAALIGIVLTGLFIIVVYRLMGFLATVALACYALISYAALIAIGATLTLPGLAGFVLAIGMAVDANVLVFERAREEYAGDKSRRMHRSLVEGFRNAFSAVADSNITTLLAAGLLFFLASGPVRGFGVTLSIGVIASMVSALIITRVLAEIAAQRGIVVKRPRITGIASIGRVRTYLTENEPRLMNHGRKFLALSAVAIVVSFAGIAVRGLEFGVEFTGGRLVEFSTTEQVDVDDARDAVSDAGFPRAVVQESGDANISVRTEELTNTEREEIREAIGELGGGAEVERDELIGPSMGDELRRNALIALGVALAAQLAYLAFRFRWTFAVGAVVALFHNVILVTGIFAWFGKPIDGIFLAAMLTIIGYTVNDSVVVFDRIRETWGYARSAVFSRVANTSVIQTLPRTINTGLSTIFILAALLFLGGDSLADFALALLLGVAIGTYSSSLVATPLAIELEKYNDSPPPPPKRDPDYERKKRQVRRDTSGAVV